MLEFFINNEKVYFICLYFIILLILIAFTLNVYLMFYNEEPKPMVILCINVYFSIGHLMSYILFIPILSKLKIKLKKYRNVIFSFYLQK